MIVERLFELIVDLQLFGPMAQGLLGQLTLRHERIRDVYDSFRENKSRSTAVTDLFDKTSFRVIS
jgi:hypothetical protein